MSSKSKALGKKKVDRPGHNKALAAHEQAMFARRGMKPEHVHNFGAVQGASGFSSKTKHGNLNTDWDKKSRKYKSFWSKD